MDFYLIKLGRIARPENGQYHCGKLFEDNDQIKDSVGAIIPKKQKCSFINHFFCKECEILDKQKKIYLKYVYNIK